MSRRHWIGIAGSAAISSLAFPRVGIAHDGPDDFHQHRASRRGFYANSYLIEGDHSCALIDTHLNIDEAKDLATLINTVGKPLETIVITHPHPDHYLGLEHLGPLFPNAVVRSSQKALEIIRVTSTDWPVFSNQLKPLRQGEFATVGRSFECILLPDAESVAPVVLFEAESKTLIAGDHILNGQHHWLVEGRIAAWRRNLTSIENRWSVKTVLPGHGAVGGPTLIAQSDAYLRDFQSLLGKGLSAAQIRQKMLQGYPKHTFVEALDNSILALT